MSANDRKMTPCGSKCSALHVDGDENDCVIVGIVKRRKISDDSEVLENDTGSTNVRGTESLEIRSRKSLANSSIGSTMLENEGKSAANSSKDSEDEDDNDDDDDDVKILYSIPGSTTQRREENMSSNSNGNNGSSVNGRRSRNLSPSSNTNGRFIREGVTLERTYECIVRSYQPSHCAGVQNGSLILSENGEFILGSCDDLEEKCPICFKIFTDQEVASPELCKHIFCCACLVEWAKTANTCPVDRKIFSFILVKNQLNDNKVRMIRIDTNVIMLPINADDQNAMFCWECHQSYSEDNSIRCRACYCVFHLGCHFHRIQGLYGELWVCQLCSVKTINSVLFAARILSPNFQDYPSYVRDCLVDAYTMYFKKMYFSSIPGQNRLRLMP